MGDQHQTAGKPAKPERRVEHHRERQSTRAALRVSDLEDVLDPPSVHNTAVAGLPEPVEAKPRRFRHWKQPFWKRRSNRRQARNVANEAMEHDTPAVDNERPHGRWHQ